MPVTFNTINIKGVPVFYRSAGPATAPVVLLLHGFPSSSHMFRNLMPLLAKDYRVIAPDYPGSGLSGRLQANEYTFDHLADLIEAFIDALELKRFSLYMQDFGGPVGFRLASRRPQQVQALLIQNANAYMEGLGPGIHNISQYKEKGDEQGFQKMVDHIMSLPGIKENYLYNASSEQHVLPDGYLLDHYFALQPGAKEAQAALLLNYKTNFPQYPVWHEYFRQHQPPTLITWGIHDDIFILPGARAYLTDLPKAALHEIDGGHFLLEEKYEEVAALILRFLSDNL
ncbi:alpha/beta fold hydrolase [Chitinophaga vietnamensis]|uniref:alpha/beta fold hydrolase n=1 Tax=Chitinophaga vietnamensis TaxID=2593957 RepID=UPI001178650F|nr:alpha/beta hydrolase [Chitinophaga vietnamensis]